MGLEKPRDSGNSIQRLQTEANERVENFDATF